jgi:phenylpropionate dioxygenase-like ring-hydroxylating dioxygenase large terminal subunit
LCEEIVVFRDKKGQVGALDPDCSHRGTSLEWGRVEEEGVRCCYHGWPYDTQGQCIDMPCETEEFRQAMDVWEPAYPVTEYGGLIFVCLLPTDRGLTLHKRPVEPVAADPLMQHQQVVGVDDVLVILRPVAVPDHADSMVAP